MGTRRAQHFVMGILRLEMEYSTDNVTIEGARQCQDENREGSNKETLDGIDSNIITSQLDNTHVLTVDVGNYAGITKGQMVDWVGLGQCEHSCTQYNTQSNS